MKARRILPVLLFLLYSMIYAQSEHPFHGQHIAESGIHSNDYLGINFGPYTAAMQILTGDNNSLENGGDVDEIIRLHEDMGFRYERASLAWSLAEYPKGTYHWDEFDTRLDKMFNAGITPVITVCSGNDYDGTYQASIPGLDNASGTRADYLNFVKKVVERYDGDGIDDGPVDGVIKIWEGWNEPINWHHKTVEQITEFHNQYYDAIKKADASAVVASPGFAWMSPFEYFVPNGKYDMLSVHSTYWYTDDADPSKSMLNNIEYKNQRFKDLGLGNKPWWISEFGIIGRGWENMDHYTYTHRIARMYVVALYQMFHTNLIAATQWYGEQNKTAIYNWGEWTLRPCGQAVKVVLYIFQDSTLVNSEMISSTGYRAMAFENQNGLKKYAAWCWEGSSKNVTFDVNTSKVKITDMLAQNVRTVEATNGQISLSLDETPVYIEEISDDTVPPNSPQNFGAINITERSLTLTWDPPSPASDGDVAVSYELRRDGQILGNITDTQFDDTNLESNTLYTYEIYSIDDAGNKCSGLTKSYQTAADQSPPQVSRVRAESDNIVHIMFNEPVDQTVAENISNYSIDNSVSVQHAVLESGHNVVLTVSTLQSGQTYQLTVDGIKDLVGNVMSDPQTVNFSYTGVLEITNVYAASGKNYSVKKLKVGDLIYSDRNYNIEFIPPQYEGEFWVQTANDDKMASTPTDFLTFSVNQSVNVFVGYDDRLSLPAWLNNWEDTGDIIESDYTAGKDRYRLYKKTFQQGQVRLGPNNAQTNSSNMYIVLIEKFDSYDQYPPIVSNIQTQNIGLTTATVTWTTNEPTNSKVEYGKTTSYGSSVQESELKATHQLTLTNLEPASIYHFRIHSKDGSNNETVTDDQQFSTLEASELVTWHSYNVVTSAGDPQAEVKDETGSVTAYLEFYESTDDDGVQKGELFQYFFAEKHKEHLVTDFWTSYSHNSWDDEAVPYVGKSTAPRGSLTQPSYFESNPPEPTGVYDIKMHPPKNDHSTVIAFIIPVSGDYTISDLAFRRDNEWLAAEEPRKSVRFRIFNHKKQLLCDKQYISQQYKGPWMILSETFELPGLQKGDRLYFTLNSDGDWGWDKTDVTWTISAVLINVDTEAPNSPTGLTVF